MFYWRLQNGNLHGHEREAGTAFIVIHFVIQEQKWLCRGRGTGTLCPES